jgi:hypothetical protein
MGLNMIGMLGPKPEASEPMNHAHSSATIDFFQQPVSRAKEKKWRELNQARVFWLRS